MFERPIHLRLPASRLGGFALALGAAAVAAGRAEAAPSGAAESTLAGYTRVDSMPGVVETRSLADGSVEIAMADGRILRVPAEYVAYQDGVMLVDTRALDDASFGATQQGGFGGGGGAAVGGGAEGGSALPALLALGAAGAGIALAASADGDDDDGDGPDGAPVFTSSGLATTPENTTATGYVAAATDPESEPVRYAIVGGADRQSFTIDAQTGVLSFRQAPDFEVPGDSDGDNVYEVVVRASDGDDAVRQTVNVQVTDGNDQPPSFTSETDPQVPENETATGYTAQAVDPDGDALTYSIVAGVDADLFTIDSATGALAFRQPPDFENPADADGNNVYQVVVGASDGINTVQQAISVRVTDVADLEPIFDSGTSATTPENNTATGYTAQAFDPDGTGSISYSIAGGPDADAFSIDATTGVLSFGSAPDFENPSDADGDNVYEVAIEANDGQDDKTRNVDVTVTDTNDEAPVFQSGTSASTAENDTETGYVAEATDPDGAAVTYRIAGGADADLFRIDPQTGALAFRTAPDFENPADANADNVYVVAIAADDGVDTSQRTVRVSVTDLDDDPPEFRSGTAVAVSENQLSAYTAAATDDDTVTYSLSGTDADLFAVDAQTGEVRFLSAPDFENPADADADNLYELVVTATDGTNAASQAVTVEVVDVADETAGASGGGAGAVARLPETTEHATDELTVGTSLSEDGAATPAEVTTLLLAEATDGAESLLEAELDVPGAQDLSEPNAAGALVAASRTSGGALPASAASPTEVTDAGDPEAVPAASFTGLDGSDGW